MNGFCCPSSGRIQCRRCIIETEGLNGGTHHANLNNNCCDTGVIGAIAVGSAVPAAAWYGYHHRYYHHHYGYYPYHHRHYYAYHPYYHHRYYHQYWHHGY